MDLPSHSLQTAVRLFDEANARDPHVEMVEGEANPRELVYARRLTEWVLKLCPHPSEALLLAARCQHICRWKIPRADYPEGRAGYLKWRADLKAFHARLAGEILAQAGYGPDIIARVQSLNLKKNFPHDPDSRVLEDALCLLFLEHQLPDLMSRLSEEKMLNALRKSWNKMSPAAREWAGKLPLNDQAKQVIERALRPHDPPARPSE